MEGFARIAKIAKKTRKNKWGKGPCSVYVLAKEYMLVKLLLQEYNYKVIRPIQVNLAFKKPLLIYKNNVTSSK